MSDLGYRLLHDMTGVMPDRTPMVSDGKFHFSFDLAPEGAVAVFRTPSRKIYKSLTNGACELDAAGIEGEVGVTVAQFEGLADAKRWKCDGLVIHHLSSGEVLVVPSDGNLSEEVAKLRVRLDEAEQDRLRLGEEIQELRAMYQKIMDGYNIV